MKAQLHHQLMKRLQQLHSTTLLQDTLRVQTRHCRLKAVLIRVTAPASLLELGPQAVDTLVDSHQVQLSEDLEDDRVLEWSGQMARKGKSALSCRHVIFSPFWFLLLTRTVFRSFAQHCHSYCTMS